MPLSSFLLSHAIPRCVRNAAFGIVLEFYAFAARENAAAEAAMRDKEERRQIAQRRASESEYRQHPRSP